MSVDAAVLSHLEDVVFLFTGSRPPDQRAVNVDVRAMRCGETARSSIANVHSVSTGTCNWRADSATNVVLSTAVSPAAEYLLRFSGSPMIGIV